ncbi:MAG: hypothetical protein PHW56_12425 [Methanosarcinaceae archaeon]|nr:hypothetical protein [Methanosarcinaceae archaeon]
MEGMNGAEVLGVRHIFGYHLRLPSSATIFGYTGVAILPVFQALGHSYIEVIVNSNE